MKKFASLPVFLLIVAAVCVLLRVAGFVFVSQISNYFAIAIIVALAVKDCCCEKNALCVFAPIAAVFYVFATLFATETTTFSYSLMVVVALVCGITVAVRHGDGTKTKLVLGGLYTFLTLPIFLVAIVMIFFHHVFLPFSPGSVEMERISEISPGGVYIIEAVRGRQQVTSDGTDVFIMRHTDGVNLLIGRLEPLPRLVFGGHGGEFHNIIRFRWDGDNRVYMYRQPQSSAGGGDSYVFELVGRRWRRSVFTPEQSVAEQPTPTPSPTLPPYYTQKSGRITSIHGLVGADGAIHELAEWVHIHIEDENGEEITLVATSATIMPVGNLAAGEQVTAYILSGRRLSCEPRMYIASAFVTEECEPIPIIDAMLTSESFGVVIPESESGVEFLLPKMYSFADFETFDLPLFIEQELFSLPLPMILHHCGTIMAPFKPIGENFWFVDFWINNGSPLGGPPSGPTFGTSGGGSGETARMIPGSNIAWGTGFSATLVTPPILVDGIFYVPLFGVFATASPFPSTDAFIYNDEVHIVPAGWSILHGRFSARQGWGGDSPERPISTNVSALPIFVEGRRLDIPSAILTESAYDILLPIIPIAYELGFSLTLWDCGEIMYVDGCPMRGRFIIAQPSVNLRERFPDLRWPILQSASFRWIDDELYGELWDFFRGALDVGGFASYTRIELFNTGAMWGIMP